MFFKTKGNLNKTSSRDLMKIFSREQQLKYIQLFFID